MPETVPVTDKRELARAGSLTALYLLSLEIENFRCFKDRQTLKLTTPNGLPAQWTIIIGENGTGKTTLLECIASAFPITAGNKKVNEKTKQPTGSIDLLHLSGNWESYFKTAPSRLQVCANLHTGPLNKRGQKSSVSIENIAFDDLKDVISKMGKAFREASVHINLPGSKLINNSVLIKSLKSKQLTGDSYFSLLAAYGANRLAKTSDSVSLSESDSSGPVATLFSLDARLRNAEEWLLQTDYASRVSTGTTEENTRRPSHVRDALLRMLPEILDIDIIADKDGALPSVQFKTRFGALSLRQLSLGYQTTIAWIVDLASRMRDHYPDAERFLEQPAVALIDEIDLHMHPRWQRQIMAMLSHIFPNVQFIATSHSPLVVQAVEDANTAVLICANDQVVIHNDVQSVHGWRVDQILTSDLFGLNSARPPRVEKLLEQRKKLLTKARLTKKDREKLNRLNEKIGYLPTGESPAEQAAIAIITRAAQRLRDS